MGERQAYWESAGGELEDVKLIDYTGDGTNDRVIALGGVFDTVEVLRRGPLNPAVDHLGRAFAVRDVYMAYYQVGGSNLVRHVGGSFTDTVFQGFNPARDGVILGSSGGTSPGTNFNAATYRLVAKKFRSMV